MEASQLCAEFVGCNESANSLAIEKDQVRGKSHVHLGKDLFAIFIGIRDLILGFKHCSAEFCSESLCDLHRFTNACALDDDIFNLILLGQVCKFREQVSTESAADTAILKLDQFLFRLGYFVMSYESSIDVEPGNISKH